MRFPIMCGRVDEPGGLEASMFQAFGIGGQALGPEECAMISGVVTEYCREKGYDLGGPQANDAASEILRWFHAGVSEKAKLRELLYSRS